MVKKINAVLQWPDLYAAKPFAWPALYAILMAVGMHTYLPYDQANFWLGILAIGLFARYPGAEKSNNRFLVASIACLIMYLILPVKTSFFFALVFAFLYSIENITGKLHAAIIPVIFLMSPVANYAAEVFSFPVRLQLSSWAAQLLQAAGAEAVAHGNSIDYNGATFDVDHACVGLSMLVSSLLMGIIAIQVFEAKFHRRLPLLYIPLVLIYFSIANILANLIRIVCLVYFQLAPGTFMHETVGLSCWLLYGILPCLWLVKMMVMHLGNYESVLPVCRFKKNNPVYYPVYQLALVGLFTLFINWPAEQTGTTLKEGPPEEIIKTGYTATALPHDVVRLQNSKTLIYLKAIRGFYSTDHNPSICWRGSGYAFTRVKNVKRGNAHLYMAQLEKEGTILYTAWWYESGARRTNNQFSWRWQNFRAGRTFHLVNITTASKNDLEIAIQNWIQPVAQSLSLQ
jgi:exosortase N